jgi:hypothetical protein
MPNYNQKTGLPFGVANAHDFWPLLSDIQDWGTNESEKEAVDSLKERLLSFLDGEPIRDRERAAEDTLDVLLEYAEFELEECSYSYETDGTRYLLSYLGGAPLIWVIESNYACYCHHCSPCVPGAGDLNSPDGTTLAHCMPPPRGMESRL